MEIKKERFKTRQELADFLDISSKSQERWIKKYIISGIEGLLSDLPKNLKSRIITSEIHEALSKRVNSSDNPFLGYWDALSWVKSEYNIDVKYHLLRHYLIKNFKTKLKSPRKSHYAKDDEAIKSFLKTP